MTKKLEGRVAIVTGAGQGVGKGIAVGLARQGARVMVNDLRPEMRRSRPPDHLSEAEMKRYQSLSGDADSTVQQIVAEGGEAISVYADMTDHQSVGDMVQQAVDTFGHLDIVVNNAAGMFAGPLTGTIESAWELVTQAKLKGTYNLMKHAAPFMMEQKFGRIINISSYAWMGLSGLTGYSAANAGVVGFTKAVAKEMSQSGVTANVICPEADSPAHILEFSMLVKNLRSAGIDIPQEKLQEIAVAHGPPENLAPFIGYLCTDEGAYISGAVFAVTGGGRINYFTEPVMKEPGIEKKDSPWTIEELIETVPNTLLTGYRSIVELDEMVTMLNDINKEPGDAK